MKKPIRPGELLKDKRELKFDYLMFIETKENDRISYRDSIFFEHWFLDESGQMSSIIDDNRQFFIEKYNWLERVKERE
jgi:hypothetical protein